MAKVLFGFTQDLSLVLEVLAFIFGHIQGSHVLITMDTAIRIDV